MIFIISTCTRKKSSFRKFIPHKAPIEIDSTEEVIKLDDSDENHKSDRRKKDRSRERERNRRHERKRYDFNILDMKNKDSNSNNLAKRLLLQ